MSILAGIIASDGSALPAVQPEKNTVVGSPFIVSGGAVLTPELKATGIMIFATQSIHFRFNDIDETGDATTNDMVLPGGVSIVIPVQEKQTLSMISIGVDATVYIEALKRV